MELKLLRYSPSDLSIRRWTPSSSQRSREIMFPETLSESFMPSCMPIQSIFLKHNSQSRKLLKTRSRLPEIKNTMNKVSDNHNKTQGNIVFVIKKRISKSKSLKIQQSQKTLKLRKLYFPPVERDIKKSAPSVYFNNKVHD